jgi:hypothetical protein
MNFRSKYDPAQHDGDDIYTCIHDEAMTVLAQSTAATNSASLARYVAGRLALDPEDLPLIERSVGSAFTAASDPEIVANWRAVKSQRDARQDNPRG